MKKNILIIFSLITIISCRQHNSFDSESDTLSNPLRTSSINNNFEHKKDSLTDDFSNKWKSDSLGLNGFRSNHYSLNRSAKTWIINGVNFKGYNKEKVLKILGKPTSFGYGKEDGLLIFDYIVNNSKGTKLKSLTINFNHEDNVGIITESTGY